jgi:hypothetical protein
LTLSPFLSWQLNLAQAQLLALPLKQASFLTLPLGTTSSRRKVIMDADGDPTASTYYGEGIEGTLSGYLPTTTPFSTTLAASATISDTPTDFLVGSVGSVSIVENVSITKSNEDYIRIEVGFSNFAGIT